MSTLWSHLPRCSRKSILTKYFTIAHTSCAKVPLYPSVGQRHFKYNTRSFLSDEEGVNNFIDLLGGKERKLLLDQLKIRTSPSNIGEDTSHGVDVNQPLGIGHLRLIFVHQLLPFVGFGFLDNLIMILAGDYIDVTIGATLGISTMAAAGLGNALSDVAGVGSAWYVERLAASVGIEHPHISPEQASHARTRWTVHTGRAFGVFVGCVLGMVPLFFLPKRNSKEKDKSEKSDEASPKK